MAVVVSNFRWSGGWYLRSRPTARVGSKFPQKCQFFSPNCNFFFTQGRFFGDVELTIFLKGSSLKGNLQISHLNHVRSCVEYMEDIRQLPLHSCQNWLSQPKSKTISDHIGQVPPRAAWRRLLRPRLTNLDGLVHQVHHLRHVVDHDDHCHHQVLLTISRSLQQRVRGPWGECWRGGAVGEDHRLKSLREVPYSPL